MEIGERIKRRREQLGMSQAELAEKVGYTSRSSIAKLETNANGMTQSKIISFANALKTTPSYLMGWEDDFAPNIAEKHVTFPVIGEVAAGYDRIAIEDWEGDVIDIPISYLHGRSKEDYFVLKVKGDSMYPAFMEGDRVMVLKQDTLDYSGQVGVVLYDDDSATLKKIEFKQGEDWLRLVPINPTHPTVKVTNEKLEHCRVIGVPKLLIRNIGD